MVKRMGPPPSAPRRPPLSVTTPALPAPTRMECETELDRVAAANPDPGRVSAHRLNRTEYANAIRDLLSLEIDAKALLLPDEADEGFDNVADSLALSTAHVERYLSAARTISRLAI